eukprot:TRINITY_DN9893_c0_g1_i1.p1 TRINITY_DN9893_c0_g1~~TRINITY_DN9893_c0_g1_i1.p1  ORF type:complete len:120 (-),score=14.29 TRINITY_DN9893_c0_g1_i1:59-418(-)
MNTVDTDANGVVTYNTYMPAILAILRGAPAINDQSDALLSSQSLAEPSQPLRHRTHGLSMSPSPSLPAVEFVAVPPIESPVLQQVREKNQMSPRVRRADSCGQNNSSSLIHISEPTRPY